MTKGTKGAGDLEAASTEERVPGGEDSHSVADTLTYPHADVAGAPAHPA
ncbi:MAG TPA: hypothetical protein VID73_03575 [Ktedonobacterales bacterium]